MGAGEERGNMAGSEDELVPKSMQCERRSLKGNHPLYIQPWIGLQIAVVHTRIGRHSESRFLGRSR